MDSLGASFPWYAVLPFAVMLGGIALLPLLARHSWESNRNKAVFVALLALPTGLYLASRDAAALWHALHEYASFIALLGSLYVVAGGIQVSGDLRATPRNNTVILAIGAVLANLVGTTGASMLLIRLLLRTNSERRNIAHVPFSFILIVSNCGGLLTPLADPPLFLGYLRGVPFTWTLGLWPYWLGVVAYLLGVFYMVDARRYRRERPRDLLADATRLEPLRIRGLPHLALLGGVVGAIFLPSPYRELAMVGLSLASLYAFDSAPRKAQDFSFAPIVEVAVLFAGIFVTMVPALALLETHGSQLGLSEPWHFFLTTGGLSSVLDNAPTYLTFLSTAQGMHLHDEVVGVPAAYLRAISLGAVFMGANTYIGNGPNFMVKAIAEQAGVRMPSFLGFALRATLTLMPAYVVLAFLLSKS
jgi:Na+/H+ antiporter NhaD/arsenite permease-like protein